MGQSDSRSQATIGFLTVREHEQQGLVGGYLILNAAGRPLEFHCTAPFKPSRAQQILYGPTLHPFLYGEQIGQTLLAKGGAQPQAVCTDSELALSVRTFVKLPVALVLSETKPAPIVAPTSEATAVVPSPASDRAPIGPVWRLDAAHSLGANLNTFHVGRNLLAVLAAEDDDRGFFETRGAAWGELDLGEPFVRIQEAIEEALKSSRG
jgi:hypothetical protein